MIIYDIFIRLFQTGIKLAALRKPKAAQWVGGRENLFEELAAANGPADRTIWMHCASAGELEQGKTVLEALKRSFPHFKIIVTFFSPSGYHVGKRYKGADHVFYLPLDTARNASRFVESVHPSLVLFVKYDYWYHHLKSVRERQIPLLLISAIYRENGIFFKWYGGFHRKMLHFFTRIFVQDEASAARLHKIGVTHCTVAGDTRFDRVKAIVKGAQPIELIESFLEGSSNIVGGSTWEEDESLFRGLPVGPACKLIIAPHEISARNVERLLNWFSGRAITYSQLQGGITRPASYSVLIVDNIGMLSRLYQYATLAYIGGGFNKSGIHNTLEAAAWGKPVLFGPNYGKFREAIDLLNAGAAFSVSDAEGLKATMADLLKDGARLQKAGMAARNYVEQNGGATEAILSFLQENRLLTT